MNDLVVTDSSWLRYPNCPKGIGDVIRTPDSADLIAGVRVYPAPLHPDDRGYFMEVFRSNTGLGANFPAESTQVSMAMNYPGIIKAFHFHRHQTDLWAPSAGMFQVALVDLRSDSPTFGKRNTFYVGGLRPRHDGLTRIMKRTERQHLKENEFAQLAASTREALEERGGQLGKIIIGVVVVLVAVIGVTPKKN